VATIERLRALPDVSFVSGNTDRYSLTNDRPPPTEADVLADPTLLPVFAAVARSFAWTRGALAAHGLLDWLATLPASVSMTLPDGTRVLGVHASPKDDDGRGISPERDEAGLAADLAGVDADIVIGGHTHRQTDRLVGAVRALNGGSVSNPQPSDLRAGYLVIDADTHGHRVELRRVEYDHEEFLRRVYASNHPEADYIASHQRVR